MNLRARRRVQPESEVMLSPLIDCVFLLLIFFLVTSMFKRFERQIPVSLTDDTSAISAEGVDVSVPIGVDRDGRLYRANGLDRHGATQFSPIAEPGAFLQNLFAKRGALVPVIVVVERGTHFQKVIDAQDRLEIRGLRNVSFRVREASLKSGQSLRD
jgi:biopolymer transport protein ExbD